MLLRERGALSMVSFSIAEASSTRYRDFMYGLIKRSNQLATLTKQASVHAEQLAFVGIVDSFLPL